MPGPLAPLARYDSLFLRLALGTAFLSAVADRFGLWGPPGTYGVNWGHVANFEAYVGMGVPFLPAPLVPAAATIATAAETLLGLALVFGYRTRQCAGLSGVLLLVFAIGMAAFIGIKSPLDYSVFTASAGAFVLASRDEFPCSLDARMAGGTKPA